MLSRSAILRRLLALSSQLATKQEMSSEPEGHLGVLLEDLSGDGVRVLAANGQDHAAVT